LKYGLGRKAISDRDTKAFPGPDHPVVFKREFGRYVADFKQVDYPSLITHVGAKNRYHRIDQKP
jgi:hypothetical protein